MKAIAEFALRGRLQALALTVLGASTLLFSWVSAGIIALVVLCRSVADGVWLWFWGMLPAGFLLLVYGDGGPLSLLTGTLLMAILLQMTGSLALASLGAIAVGLLSALALLTLGGHFLDQMVQVFAEFVGRLEQWMNANAEQPVELARPGRLQVAGMMGASNAFGATLCLFLGRWWQAALTHPGGFGKEFRALYFPAQIALPLVLICLVVLLAAPQAASWAAILAMPLLFAGLALAHAWAARSGLGVGWLALFYVILVVVDLAKGALIALAAVDSWYNFRARWRSGGDKTP